MGVLTEKIYGDAIHAMILSFLCMTHFLLIPGYNRTTRILFSWLISSHFCPPPNLVIRLFVNWSIGRFLFRKFRTLSSLLLKQHFDILLTLQHLLERPNLCWRLISLVSGGESLLACLQFHHCHMPFATYHLAVFMLGLAWHIAGLTIT